MNKTVLGIIPVVTSFLLTYSCAAAPHTDQPIAYKFTFGGTNCNIEHQSKYETKIYEGDKNITFTINPEYDFVLIQSDIGIVGENTTYDEETHILTISEVVGDVTVTANATTKPTFTFHGRNCNIGGDQDITKAPLKKGAKDITYQINLDESYTLEGKDLKITGENVQYSSLSHELTITEVTSSVTVEADAYIVKTFGFNGTNCNINGSSTILANPLKKGDKDVKFTISVEAGYALKGSDVSFTGDNVSYDANTRTVTISEVVSDVKITATATPLTKRKITAGTLTNCHFYEEPEEDGYIVGSEVKLKLVGDMVGIVPYAIPKTVSVTGLETMNWNYDSTTGLFTISELPTGAGDIVISASSDPSVQFAKIDNTYQIVLGENQLDRCQDAHQINDAIAYCGGPILKIVNAKAAKTSKEIILDNNREESRALSEKLTDEKKRGYAIEVNDDGKVIIGYQSKLARTCAIDRLLTDFLYSDGLYVPIGLKATGTCLEKNEIVTDITLPRDTPDTYRTVRDPYIFRNGNDYYMYGTIGDEWRVYYAKDTFKNGWRLLNKSIVDETQYKDIKKNRWAPEMHKYKDNYYLFTTYYSKRTVTRGVTIFRSDSLTEGFKMISRNEGNEIKPGHITNDEEIYETIDGSLYVDQRGQPWMVYVDEWVGNYDDHVGRMDIVKMSDDLSTIDESTNVELFTAHDAAWSTDDITDGCFIHRHKNGLLTMLWSNFDRGNHYVVGLVNNHVPDDYGIDNPKSWIHQKRTLYTKDIYDGALDGGHAMIFDDPSGQLYLCLHIDNHEEKVKSHANIIPIKEAYGTLVWDLYNHSIVTQHKTER